MDANKVFPDFLSWKKKHGTIFYLNVCGRKYIYRTLTRGEYLAILNLQEKLSIDTTDLILKGCLLYPKFEELDFDMMLAGEVESLIDAIGKTSGFSETDKVMEDINAERGNIGTLENQIIVLICKAFPHLTLEHINNFTYEEMVKYLVLSETILDVKLNIEKPKPQKPGTIDFDEENKVFSGEEAPRKSHPKSRGDVGK